MNNRELACLIARDLFTNGAGKRAQRLVLELPGLKDGGGWIESAVAYVIEDYLDKAQSHPTTHEEATPLRRPPSNRRLNFPEVSS